MFFQRCQICGNRTALFSNEHDCTPRASATSEDDGVDVTRSPFYHTEVKTTQYGDFVPVGLNDGLQSTR